MTRDKTAPERMLAAEFHLSENCRVRTSQGRRRLNAVFRMICASSAAFAVITLISILFLVGMMGRHALLNLPDPDGDPAITTPSSTGLFRTDFLANPPSDHPSEAGIGPALMGTLWVCGISVLLALPIGIGTAIFLEEYNPRRKLPRLFQALIQMNVSSLAGIPSVVYGIVGLTAFVFTFDYFGMNPDSGFEFGARYYDEFRTVDRGPRGEFLMLRVPVSSRSAETTTLQEGMTAYLPSGETAAIHIRADGAVPSQDVAEQTRTVSFNETPVRISQKRWYYFCIPLGRGVLAGSLTLMLVILPVVIIAAQEALRAVPNSLREAASGLGATSSQIVRNVTLPASLGSMLTGSILAVGRAIGEAAPMLMIVGAVNIKFFPNNAMDPFTVLPTQIYVWTTQPETAYHQLAAGAIIVLLLALLLLNIIAFWIRNSIQKPTSD